MDLAGLSWQQLYTRVKFSFTEDKNMILQNKRHCNAREAVLAKVVTPSMPSKTSQAEE